MVKIWNQASAELLFPSRYTWCRHHRLPRDPRPPRDSRLPGLLDFKRASEQRA